MCVNFGSIYKRKKSDKAGLAKFSEER